MSMTCVGIQWVVIVHFMPTPSSSLVTGNTRVRLHMTDTGWGKDMWSLYIVNDTPGSNCSSPSTPNATNYSNGKPIFSLMAIENFKCLSFHRWLLCFWSDWLTCGVPGWNPGHSRSTSLINVFMPDIDQINHMLSSDERIVL